MLGRNGNRRGMLVMPGEVEWMIQRGSGPDEQVPPSGRDKRVPPKVGGHAYHARSIAYRRQPPKPRPSPP
jgi:hypothetical protein